MANTSGLAILGTGSLSTASIGATPNRATREAALLKPPVMAPWSLPTFLLGLHVLQGIVAGINSDVPEQQLISQSHLSGLPDIKSSADIRRLMPRKRQLKPQRLLKKMGKDFDDFWMAKELPSDFLEVTARHTKDVNLIPDSQLLDFSSFINSLYSHGEPSHSNFNATAATTADPVKGNNSSSSWTNTRDIDQLKRKLQSFLVDFSSCEVFFQWEDLGLLYWPRWIRKGSCSLPNTEWNSQLPVESPSTSSFATSSKSCSWPSGMHCVPNKAKKLKILHWTCRPAKGSDLFHRFRQSGRRKSSRRNKDDGINQSVGSPEDKTEHGLGHDLAHQAGNEKTGDELNSGELLDEFLSQRGRPSPKLDLPPPSLNHGRDKWSGGMRNRPRRSRDEEAINKTEDWNKGRWKGKRRRPHVKCRWVRIPIPVIDDCYCSC